MSNLVLIDLCVYIYVCTCSGKEWLWRFVYPHKHQRVQAHLVSVPVYPKSDQWGRGSAQATRVLSHQSWQNMLWALRWLQVRLEHFRTLICNATACKYPI